MNAPEPMTHCPSEETLAAFIDGRLDPESRRKVVEHMTTCAECRSTVLTATDFAAQSDAPAASGGGSVSRFSPRFYFSAAAALAAAAVVIVLFGPMIRERVFPEKTGIAALVEVSETMEVRPTPGRLAGGFPYRKEAPTMRGAEERADNIAVLAVAAKLEQTAHADPSGENLHALGVGYLLAGDVRRASDTIKRAILISCRSTSLIDAIHQCSDPTLLNDFTVIYHSRALRSDGANELFAASEAIQRAWRLSRSAPIAWNRALVLEEQGLRERAISAWNDYLNLDASSGWADEARQRIIDLDRPTDALRWNGGQRQFEETGARDSALSLVMISPQRARLFGEDDLLPQWGDCQLRGEASCEHVLSAARHVAAELHRKNNESLLTDAISVIDLSSNSGRVRLAAAHNAYGRGRKAFDAGDFETALRLFTEARLGFKGTNSPFELVAAMQVSTCALARGDVLGVAAEINALQRAVASNSDRYRSLAARLSWLLGLAEDHAGRTASALAAYQESLVGFGRQQEIEHELAVHTLIADLLARTGEIDSALRHHRKSMRMVGSTGNESRRHQALFEAAFCLLQMRFTYTAEVILDDLAEFDAQHSSPADTAVTYMWRAVLRARRGEATGARRDFAAAAEHNRAIPHRKVRERSSANLTLARVTAGDAFADGTSVDAVSTAIAFFSASNSRMWLSQLLAYRGAMHLARGDANAAMADFAAGIDTFDDLGRRLGQSRSEWLYADASDRLYENMIKLLVSQGRDEEALMYAERGTLRKISEVHGSSLYLPDVLARRTAGAPGLLRELRSRTAPAKRVVFFAQLSDRLMVWVVRADGLTLSQHFASSDDVLNAIDHFNSTVETASASDVVRVASGTVGQLFVRTWIDAIGNAEQVVFVAGMGLRVLPFAALVDPVAKDFLIRKVAISVAPSLHSIVMASVEDHRRHGQSETILFVSAANPVNSERLRWKFLRLAESEGIRSAESYGSPVILSGDQATRSRFLEAAADAVLVDFAGHAQVDRELPLRSALIFGDKPGESLALHEIGPSTFPLAQLVVLTACGTGDEPRPDVSIAAGVLGQGVPSVVATLWDVDDRSASAFGIAFHRALAARYSRGESLRRAQLSLLSSGDARLAAPRAWAAYILLGETDRLVAV